MKVKSDFRHCALYKIFSKKRLAALLGFSLPRLIHLKANPPFKKFPRNVKGKIRIIEQPQGDLLLIHRKIKNLLDQIDLPEWVFSGRKGVSHIDNGRYHLRPRSFVLKMDIKKFYPSCKEKQVFRFFYKDLQMSSDCASLLSKLLTIEGHLPVGSSSSQLLAFWSYNQCFKSIFDLAGEYKIKMSLFVDDMVFSSGENFPKGFSFEVAKILWRFGFSTKRSKTTFYGPKSFKRITGVIVPPDGRLLIPNSLLRKVIQERKNMRGKSHISDRLKGLFAASRQIDPSFAFRLGEAFSEVETER
jgi:hypothetical protein